MTFSARQAQAKRRNDLVEELAKRQWVREMLRNWHECLDAKTRKEYADFAEYLGKWGEPASYAYDTEKEFQKHKKDCRKDVRAMLKDLKELRP